MVEHKTLIQGIIVLRKITGVNVKYHHHQNHSDSPASEP